jgi:hypothetical protein
VPVTKVAAIQLEIGSNALLIRKSTCSHAPNHRLDGSQLCDGHGVPSHGNLSPKKTENRHSRLAYRCGRRHAAVPAGSDVAASAPQTQTVGAGVPAAPGLGGSCGLTNGCTKRNVVGYMHRKEIDHYEKEIAKSQKR